LPGFDPSSLLVFELDESQTVQGSQPARALMTALSRQPAIAGIAVSTDAVGRAKNLWSTDIKREGGAPVTMDIKSVSANFFEQYGIRPVAGRLFVSGLDKENDATPVVINAVAARKLGFAAPSDALGQTLLFRGYDRSFIPRRVVGIAPEIRFQSLRVAPAATMYEMSTAGATLTVRANGSIAQAQRAIEALWPHYFPHTILEVRPAKEIYAANYADDARLARLLSLATAIALVIAGCGTYVLAAETVQRRTREVALRKLYGARRRDIGKLVAGLAIARFLATYAEHAPIGWWPLALALLATLLTAAAAVARQAWLAIATRPALALRA
jgi:hypothetical protein